MPAGTIALTNGSNAVNGTGTSFTTELKQGDFVYVTVGSAPYTLVVSSVTSNTQMTLAIAFDGPTTSGLAWNAVPASMQVAITQKILNDFAQVARGRILDFQNWQKIYSSDQSVTVTRPDRTTFTGPGWGYLAASLNDTLNKNNNLNDLTNKNAALDNLGAMPSAGVTDASNAAVGRVGEYREASNAGVGLASSVFINIAAITLPAGDWDVEGIIQFNSGSATLTSIAVAINSTSSTGPGFPYTTQMPTTNGTLRIPSFKRRYSINSNTTVYLIGLANFSGSGATADGFMRARRAR